MATPTGAAHLGMVHFGNRLEARCSVAGAAQRGRCWVAGGLAFCDYAVVTRGAGAQDLRMVDAGGGLECRCVVAGAAQIRGGNVATGFCAGGDVVMTVGT